jgi:hypothetical protein
MTSWPPLAADGAHPGERLSNWLALLALLACGILWLPADSGAPVAPAGSLAARSTASSQNVIPRVCDRDRHAVASEAELHEMTAHGTR